MSEEKNLYKFKWSQLKTSLYKSKTDVVANAWKEAVKCDTSDTQKDRPLL